MSGRAFTGAVAIALVAGLAADCSGSGAKSVPSATTARSSPTASPSLTPTASPAPDASVKPVRPAAMDQVSAAGAEAVAVYFLQLFPYVFASGEVTEWEALSHPECVYCANVLSGAPVATSSTNSSARWPGRKSRGIELLLGAGCWVLGAGSADRETRFERSARCRPSHGASSAAPRRAAASGGDATPVGIAPAQGRSVQ